MAQPMWTPSREQIAASRMDAFRRQVNQQFGLSLADYAQLHEWSIQERADFWQALVAFFQVQFTTPPYTTLFRSGHMTEARWFSGATLNYAAHLLQGPDQQPALISISESGERQQLSFAELRAHVAGLQRSLSAAGVTAGDRVAAILPNGWQAVVALLATSSLGAVWSSCSPAFGSRGVVDRFGQIEPAVLIACGRYRYGGKDVTLGQRLDEVLAGLPSLRQLVLVDGDTDDRRPSPSPSPVPVQDWQDFYQPGGQPDFAALPFDHPLYILYSSGTTGAPKCIVHRAGGVLLQHLKELGLHTDLRSGEQLFYYTTCGWMMWNWLVSGLALGATLVLYNGSPFHPAPGHLLDLIDEESIAVFGVSARYLAALEKQGLHPADSHRLHSLRCIDRK